MPQYRSGTNGCDSPFACSRPPPGPLPGCGQAAPRIIMGFRLRTDSAPEQVPDAGSPAPSRRPASPEPARAIAVSATFTAEALEPSLNFWLRELGWDYQVKFAPYNQVFQQLLDPASLLARTRNGVCVVMVRWEDWSRFRGGTAPDLAELERNTRHFVAALRMRRRPSLRRSW